MKTNTKLEGFRELQQRLVGMAKAMSRKAPQKKALADAAEIIADEARMLVPVDSGNLRDSITVSDVRLGGAFKMDSTLGADGVQVFVGPRTGGGSPDGFYGHMVEFGTVKMAAQPFMRPAFDHTQGQVRSRLANELEKQVYKAAKG